MTWTHEHAQVYCSEGCKEQSLSEADYNKQMSMPHAFWKCPKCGQMAYWIGGKVED